jgi:hypothetical protein
VTVAGNVIKIENFGRLRASCRCCVLIGLRHIVPRG